MKQLFVFFILFLLMSLASLSCNKNDSSTTQPVNQPQGITVHLTSNPSGANIDLDGGTTGKTTPFTFTNLSVGTHRFRIYRNEDYSELDTSLYLQSNDERTITANISPLWNHSWSGSQFVGCEQIDENGYPTIVCPSSWSTFDTLRVPTTLNAKMTVTFNDKRCQPSTSEFIYVSLGTLNFQVASSPFVITTSNGLTAGTKGKLTISYGYEPNCDYGNCCTNGITVTSIKTETY